MDILQYNRDAWDRQVQRQNRWTVPVSDAQIEAARQGNWQIVLTPTRPIPRSWFPPDLTGVSILCLASGGGQQGPVLAAAGAKVTVFDNSPQQLAQDRQMAERHGLALEVVSGDMANLCCFADAGFDCIVHPCSNCFVPHVRPVWREAFRVLRSGGALLSGFTNGLRYIFDDERAENGNLAVRYALPYSDLTSLKDADRQHLIARGEPLEFGHTLEDQIGGQLEAGFLLSGFYEDRYPPESNDPLSLYLATFIATRAIKVGGGA